MKRIVFTVIWCLGAAAGPAAEPPRNILWDGGLETGYGNNCWGTVYGNQGPNLRGLWSGATRPGTTGQGVLTLNQRVTSRVYILDEETYSLCAWVKSGPGFNDQRLKVSLALTNLNNYQEKQKDQYGKSFELRPGSDWQRVGWSFEVRGVVRNQFHVEVAADGPPNSILLDAVSLTPGPQMPAVPRPAADVEAGFFIPEPTGIYVDGEDRVVELVIRNHGAARPAKIRWEIYDHQEELVRRGELAEDLPAESTVRRPLPMQDLPYGGYRLACAVEGMPVLGDGLVAFLPRFRQDDFPQWGADAPITLSDFTPRYLNRLGMKIAGTCSCAGRVGRWPHVNPEQGKYVWSDAAVDAARREGLEVVGYLGLKYPPAWVAAKYMKDGRVTDEQGFTKAYCDYVEAFVRHYAGRVTVIHLEDEIGKIYGEMYPRIHRAACDAARHAARQSGTTVSVGINATHPAWWNDFLGTMDRAYVDFVSQNTNLRPAWKAETLNIMRRRGCTPEYFYSMGVGQRSSLRRTSLLNVRGGDGAPYGVFAWQLMMNAWLSRPFGTEDPKDGPIVRMAYYDLRTLGQSLYLPSAGKTGIEYDNSPTLGLQAMAMQKYWLSGLRPARDPAKDYALTGEPTGHARLFAYPFRNKERAVVVLTTVDASDIKSTDFDCRWRLSGLDFERFKPVDIYGWPLKVTDGRALVRQLPVVFADLQADALAEAVSAFRHLKAEPLAEKDEHRLEVGPYVLEVNPDRSGYLRLIARRDGKDTVILEQITGLPEKLPRPAVEVIAGRLQSSATLSFGALGVLTVSLNDQGANLTWERSNTRTVPVHQTVRFRLSNGGAGRNIVIQEGDKVVAGYLREDYGALTPAPTDRRPPPLSLPAHGSHVVIQDFAEFRLPGASGQGGFSPPTGFRWRQAGGEACLEADYTVNAYPGGGTRGIQRIRLNLRVVAPPSGRWQ